MIPAYNESARLGVTLQKVLASVPLRRGIRRATRLLRPSGAGLPVALGLYTVLLPMAIYALLGTSRRLSMSTTSTIGQNEM